MFDENKDINELKAEIKRLRQGLWDCAGIAGADLDGNDSPEVLKSDIIAFALDAIKDLRESYNECIAVDLVGG